MSLTQAEVDRIAHLARLAINPQDIPGYTRNLSNILDLVAQMDSADTQGVDPMAHPQDVRQRVRADKVTEGDEHKLFQRIAPRVEAGLYLVPQVIDE